MNRNIYVDVLWHIPVTPAKLLKLTRNKQEANAMLNVFMNVLYRFGHGFISLYHRHTTEWHLINAIYAD